MDDALGRVSGFVGDVVGEVLAVPIIRLALLLVAGYIVLLWLASAWWAMADVRRRTADPVAPYLVGGAVILATPILFVGALVAYIALRPPRTLADHRRASLEARLDVLDPVAERCPSCGLQVADDWLRCPACRERLAYECASCGRTVGADWELCAWCGAEFRTGSGHGAIVVDAPARPVPAGGRAGGHAPAVPAAHPGALAVAPGGRRRA